MNWLDVATVLGWAAQTTTTQAPTEPKPIDPFSMLFPIVIIGALFYFLILAPSRRDQRQRQKMIDQVAKGDSVVTSGGIHGTVEGVEPDKGIVIVNVAPKINLRFSKNAIASVAPKKSKSAEGKPE